MAPAELGTVSRSQTDTSLNEYQPYSQEITHGSSPPYVVYVRDLDYRCLEPDVYYLFGGKERVADMMMSYQKSKFTGDCLIELRTPEGLAKALALNGTVGMKKVPNDFF